jgi:hypothetical protein
MTAGTLYLVPNTLGEGDAAMLAAVLPAAVQARAGTLGYYIGENAKTTRAFLKKIGTTRPIQEIDIQELNVNTPAGAIDRLLAPVLAGADAGLVSEAGCPAVADPGALLVRRAHERGVKVVPLVGPSSILLALMASGLNGQASRSTAICRSTRPRARSACASSSNCHARPGRRRSSSRRPTATRRCSTRSWRPVRRRPRSASRPI